MKGWTFDDIPYQDGKTALVTGANTGIGLQTALMLARRGARVILCSRDLDRGQAALEQIRQQLPVAALAREPLGLELLDLADLENVAGLAARVREQNQRLDLLILNAGVMVPPAARTRQGFELQLGVNHLGHFALAGHLLPLLQRTTGARVVVVSSTAARRGRMDFSDLDFTRRGYRPWPAYCQSKLANQLFTRELQRRLQEVGSGMLVTAAHPGWTATDLQRTSRLFRFLNPLLAMSPPQGALPTMRAATDPEARPADYFGPDGFLQMWGRPVRVGMVRRARDDEAARRLWEISEERTGVVYDFTAD